MCVQVSGCLNKNLAGPVGGPDLLALCSVLSVSTCLRKAPGVGIGPTFMTHEKRLKDYIPQHSYWHVTHAPPAAILLFPKTIYGAF